MMSVRLCYRAIGFGKSSPPGLQPEIQRLLLFRCNSVGIDRTAANRKSLPPLVDGPAAQATTSLAMYCNVQRRT